ncbi:hypothetical protein N9A45_00415 [bacterium]|nr:hypothetical protein [bacterium]
MLIPDCSLPIAEIFLAESFTIAHYRLLIPDCSLPIAHYRLLIPDCSIPIAGIFLAEFTDCPHYI